MLTLKDVQDLATSIPRAPDDRSEWLNVLLTDEANLYHRFIFEVSRRLNPLLSWEIGNCERAGAGHLVEANCDGLVVAIDIDPAAKNKVDSLFASNLVALLGDSVEVLGKIKWRPRIDFLFIDGEHAQERVRAEYAAYRELVQPGGLILMDRHPPVFRNGCGLGRHHRSQCRSEQS